MDSRKLGDPSSPEFHLDKYPFYFLNRAVGRYNVVIEKRLKTIGIDIPTWRVLMILGERQPRSLGEISEKGVINLSTMQRIIERMKRAKLVSSSARKGDGRVHEVELTDLGQKKLAVARKITAKIYGTIIDGISEADFNKLISTLDRLYVNLGTLNP